LAVKEWLVPIATQLIVAAIVVRMGLRTYFNQKWWDRKSELYATIIDGLAEMARHNSVYVSRLEGEDNSPADRMSELWVRARAARERIGDAAGLGGFQISEESAALCESVATAFCISGYLDDYDQAAYLSLRLMDIRAKLIDEAKKDLKLGKRKLKMKPAYPEDEKRLSDSMKELECKALQKVRTYNGSRLESIKMQLDRLDAIKN